MLCGSVLYVILMLAGVFVGLLTGSLFRSKARFCILHGFALMGQEFVYKCVLDLFICADYAVPQLLIVFYV